MPSAPRITLEQWQALVAVVDAGSYARAAERLHKTQSTVTYAVQRVESLLGVKAFQAEGRRAVLTPTGELLYRRARVLLEEAAITEAAAQRLSAGWEAEIRIAMEHVFPTGVILECLEHFSRESPHTHVELVESVLGGTTEILLRGEADIAIAGVVPTGFLGEPLLRMRLIAVAHPDHPLHKLGRAATHQDLRAHRQLVVRESSSTRSTRPIVEASQRWTVSHAATSIRAARMGYGYAWLPEDKMREEMATNVLKPLPLREGRDRYVELYLIVARRDCAGPGVMRLAEIIQRLTPQACEREARARTPAQGTAIPAGASEPIASTRSAHRPSTRPRRARAR
jgi:DNA-binding transcriptional LysR family regulator